MNEKPEEILARLRRIQSQEYEDALAVLLQLRDGKKVLDGDLIDAAFAFTARTDLANPLVPLMSYFIERFMYFAGVPKTPKGLQRDYFATVGEESEPVQLEASKETS